MKIEQGTCICFPEDTGCLGSVAQFIIIRQNLNVVLEILQSELCLVRRKYSSPGGYSFVELNKCEYIQ